jgi:hypothetical protein
VEGLITKPCRGCKFWKPQNRLMGHCRYPLPQCLLEAVGTGVMKKGFYQWVDAVHSCDVFTPIGSQG